MSIEWYVVLSALLFATGAIGILLRRSPIVILLCLELMLNAGNLALVAFSRMVGNQQGQIFALVVMVVAACEVVVGLGLIVAIFRRKLPLDVDELRELRGWRTARRFILGLAGPAAAAARLGRRRARLPGDPGAGRRRPRHRVGRPRLPLRARRPLQPARRGRRRAPPRLLAVDLRRRRRARHQARHLRRPALRLHDPRRHRGLDADPPLLVRLHAAPTRATTASSATSTSSSSRCCCWSSPATSSC